MTDYKPGQKYRIVTIKDCVTMLDLLPSDRAEVFLRELALSVRYAHRAARFGRALSEELGVPEDTVKLIDGFIWVDDDEGTGITRLNAGDKSYLLAEVSLEGDN